MKNLMKLGVLTGGICLLAILGNPLVAAPLVAAQQTNPATEAESFESMDIAEEFLEPSREGVDMSQPAERSRWNDEVRQKNKLRRERQTAVSDLLRGRGSQVSLTEMDAWFNGYVIPSMAQADEESRGRLGEMRKTLFRSYIKGASNPQLRARLLGLLIPQMKTIVEGNYHPASRINAMVVLGELNRREGNRSARTLPVPEPDLLNYMLNVVSSATLPGYLKVPALAGIERHTAARRPGSSNPLSEPEARRIGDLMLTLLDRDETNPEDLDPKLVYWMKRRAVRILGTAGYPGDNGRYAQSVRDLILDDQADAKMRVDAVAAYGLFDFSRNPELAQIREVALAIGDFVADAAANESKYIDDKINDIRFTVKFLDEEDAKASANNGNKRVEGPNTGQDADDTSSGNSRNRPGQENEIPEVLPYYQRELVRRVFKHQAWSGRTTLVGDRYGRKGLKSYVADPASEEARLIDELVTNIDDLRKSTDIVEPDEDDEDAPVRTMSYADELKEALRVGAEALAATVAKYRPEPATAADNSDTAGETDGNSGQ